MFWNSGSDAISFNVSGTKEEDEDDDEDEAIGAEEFFRPLSPIVARLFSQRVAVVLKLVVIISFVAEESRRSLRGENGEETAQLIN